VPSSLRSGHSPEALRDELRHVRFIGGTSGSGKSTVALRLASEHGLRVYPTEPLSAYVERTTPADAPLLHTFLAMDMDTRWLNRTPEVMRDTFHGFHGEAFHLLIEDLVELPKQPPVLVEGFTLLPRLVAPLMSDPHQAVWLIATPDFRRAAFDARGTTYDIPRKTSDPERALENLLERDRLFGEDVAREAAALHLKLIRVDRSLSVDEVMTRVSKILDLPTLGHSQ
jgi:2-phosphoglycerate kinase